jgi:hypothetical protein
VILVWLREFRRLRSSFDGTEERIAPKEPLRRCQEWPREAIYSDFDGERDSGYGRCGRLYLRSSTEISNRDKALATLYCLKLTQTLMYNGENNERTTTFL